ncbi:MAG: hypothetical protein OZ921_15770 [Sorangiineae bacterium]|nr:hypothetical protein [Polyangiaceae bacterium]MEB2323970.1 hypothetical protein [Sorangiineae bacterium]
MAIIDGNSPKQTVIDMNSPKLDAWYQGEDGAEVAAHVSEAPAYDLDSATGIMAFYAEKAGELRKDRRKLLDASQRNSKISKELSDIMGAIGNSSRDHRYADVAIAIRDFLKEHRDDPNFAQLRDTLQPMLDRFTAAAMTHSSYTRDQELVESEHVLDAVDSDNYNLILSRDFNPDTILGSAHLDGYQKQVQGLLDEYSHDDALTQMSLADVQAKLGQAATLASNVLKSMNDTVAGIIGTMRG